MTNAYMKRTTVRIERFFDAPADRVFRAWTIPEEMSRWMWARFRKARAHTGKR